MSRARDVTSYKWFVRVTYPHAECKQKMSMIQLQCKSLLVVTHIGDRTEKEHIHMAMELSNAITKQGLDVKLKKIFPVRGSDYSSKIWDGNDEACSYMFHDPNGEVICSHGHTPESIQSYIAMNAKVQKIVAINKEKAPGRKTDKVVQIFNHGKDGVPSKYDVAREFVKMIREGEMYEPGDYKLKCMIEEVILKCTSEDGLESYVQNRVFNMFR